MTDSNCNYKQKQSQQKGKVVVRSKRSKRNEHSRKRGGDYTVQDEYNTEQQARSPCDEQYIEDKFNKTVCSILQDFIEQVKKPSKKVVVVESFIDDISKISNNSGEINLKAYNNKPSHDCEDLGFMYEYKNDSVKYRDNSLLECLCSEQIDDENIIQHVATYYVLRRLAQYIIYNSPITEGKNRQELETNVLNMLNLSENDCSVIENNEWIIPYDGTSIWKTNTAPDIYVFNRVVVETIQELSKPKQGGKQKQKKKRTRMDVLMDQMKDMKRKLKDIERKMQEEKKKMHGKK